MAKRVAVTCVLLLAVAASARAQNGSSGTSTGQSTTGTQTSSSSTATADETRPATTTFLGDTGLWFVPTAEVLANGKWSASAYRRGTNWIQGYTNVADFAGTFAVGIGDRAEVFGSFLVDTRIDRDIYPLFVNDGSFGGVIDRYPNVSTSTGPATTSATSTSARRSTSGPSTARTRPRSPCAAWSSCRRASPTPASAPAKPTSRSTRSSARKRRSWWKCPGYGGYEWRGKPDGFDTPGGAFRWGTGLTFPSRNFLRVVGELNGQLPSSGSATILSGTTLRGVDSTIPPTVSATENLTRATLGLTFQAKNGFFAGAGVSWNVPTRARDARVHRRTRRHRRLLRLAVPDRLSPGREGLRAAAAAATPAAGAGSAAGAHPDRQGGVRSVLG